MERYICLEKNYSGLPEEFLINILYFVQIVLRFLYQSHAKHLLFQKWILKNSVNGLNVVNFNCLREMKLKKKNYLLPEHVLTYKKVITTIGGREINSIDSQPAETVSKVENKRNSHLEIWKLF